MTLILARDWVLLFIVSACDYSVYHFSLCIDDEAMGQVSSFPLNITSQNLRENLPWKSNEVDNNGNEDTNGGQFCH